MKRIIRLTERDLTRLVKKIIKEGSAGDGTRDDFSEYEGKTDIYADNIGTEKKDDDLTSQEVAEYWARRKRKKLQESQMMMDVYPQIKKCYDNANTVSQKKFDYPTVCQKGLSQNCLDKLYEDTSRYAGANKLSGKLGFCLAKIDKKIKDSQKGMS